MTMIQPQDATSEIKKNLILSVFTLLFMLGALEIGLRILHVDRPNIPVTPKTDWALVPERIWTEYHPILGWYNQKNKHAVLKLRDFEVGVNTNSQGFRGKREYSFDKPAAVTRIVCLGDSFVFGFGVQDNESFCAQLENKNSNLEALNLGIPGYGIDQILMAYRNLAKPYQTDYVLVGIFPEGFWRATRSFADSGHAKPYFSLSVSGQLELHNVPIPPQFELNIDQFPQLIHASSTENILMHSLVYRFFKKKWIQLGKNLGWIDPDITEEWKLGRTILHELIKEIHSSGAEPLLVVLPPERWVRKARADSQRRSLLRLLEREKVGFIDLTPEFYQAVQKAALTDYYIEGDWHWTPKGHQLAADTILKFLSEKPRNPS